MNITDEQDKFLKSIKCKRLFECNCTKSFFEQFESRKGKLLIEYLKAKGRDEDSRGSTAVYIIQTTDDFPLAFFSLKCGLLFTPKLIEDAESEVEYYQSTIERLKRGRNEKDPESIQLFEHLDNLAISNGCSFEQILSYFNKYLSNKLDNARSFKEGYRKDEKEEGNKSVYRVHESFSAVELVHFCKNDNADAYWKAQRINHSLGEVIFWKIIVDKLQEIQQIVGCQYVYLFAADASEDGTLVNYYNVALKFEHSDIFGTIKPFYDFCCEFLLQDINLLIKAKDLFFSNFNLEKDTVIV